MNKASFKTGDKVIFKTFVKGKNKLNKGVIEHPGRPGEYLIINSTLISHRVKAENIILA